MWWGGAGQGGCDEFQTLSAVVRGATPPTVSPAVVLTAGWVRGGSWPSPRGYAGSPASELVGALGGPGKGRGLSHRAAEPSPRPCAGQAQAWKPLRPLLHSPSGSNAGASLRESTSTEAAATGVHGTAIKVTASTSFSVSIHTSKIDSAEISCLSSRRWQRSG